MSFVGFFIITWENPRPCKIPPVLPETAEEKRLYAEGEKNSKHRKDILGKSLVKETPNDEESDLIHAMWQRQLQYHDPNDALRKPDNVQFMDQTKLATAAIMQPQYRNRHQFMIFGGFLLKQTFELAFCCAASFAHTRPVFVSLDPSTFKNPVPVGSPSGRSTPALQPEDGSNEPLAGASGTSVPGPGPSSLSQALRGSQQSPSRFGMREPQGTKRYESPVRGDKSGYESFAPQSYSTQLGTSPSVKEDIEVLKSVVQAAASTYGLIFKYT